MRTQIAALLLLALVGCKKRETEVVTAPAQPVLPKKECYEFVSAKDTIRLSLNLSNNVTGELQYLFFEKDKSRGSLSGAFIGDTLYAEYNFKSEGTTSVREIVFVRKDDAMIPGYGDMEMKDGRELFKNPRSLAFDEKSALTKVDCK